MALSDSTGSALVRGASEGRERHREDLARRCAPVIRTVLGARWNGTDRLLAVPALCILAVCASVLPASPPISEDGKSPDIETIPLPALVIDGKPAKAHTQGLVAHGGDFFITARRDDVLPRRALLLRAHETADARNWSGIWDITPDLPKGKEPRDLLDHPGGLDSDGERLWIPVSQSRRDGRTVVRAYSIEALLAGEEAAPLTEFHVDDHIGAIAVSTRRDELYGASWDTLKVYVWNLKGELRRSFTRSEFVSGRSGWSNAVQDWNVAGDLLIAGGLDKSPTPPQDRPRALVQAIDLSSRTIAGELRLDPLPGIGDLTREGMTFHAGSLWLLPEDLGPTNRVFRIDGSELRTDSTLADRSYWDEVASGKRVPEFHFIVDGESWKKMHPERRRPEPGRRPQGDAGGERRPRPEGGPPPPRQDFPRRPPRPGFRPGPPPGRPGPPPMDGVSYSYVKAAMEVDGRRFEGIGLRFKGNSSYWSSGDRPRKPFKVDTNRFTEGLRFHGRTKLNFSNAFKDPTYMKEKLGYEVYRAAGLPTPDVGWARIYLTVDGLYEKELLGLYVLVEQVDERFIEEGFGAASRGSVLLKPERLHDLVYLGEALAAYDRYDIKEGKESTKLLTRLVEFLRLIELGTAEDFSREIGDRLDLEGLAGYLAATALLSSLDSFAGTPHNFYMMVDAADGKVKLLPWDLNETFATFTLSYGPESLVRWDIDRPWATHRRVLERLFELESFRSLYLARVKELLETSFTEKALLARIDELRAIIEPRLVDDPFGRGVEGLARGLEGASSADARESERPRPFRGFRRPRQPAIGIKPFIRDRIRSVKRQLAGEEEGERLEGRRRAFPIRPR